MDTTTNFRITIPKPCHENWEKMTPDQKGAFCKVCSKSVYDFTKKTVEEIKTVLVEQIEAGAKVCGRFNESQLSPVPQKISLNPFDLNFARLKKFALALYLVFGGMLFTTIKSSAQKMGKIALREPRPKGEIIYNPAPQDTTLNCKTSLKGDVKVDKAEQGEVSITPEPTHLIAGTAVIEPIIDTTVESIVAGGIAIDWNFEAANPLMGDTIISEVDSTIEFTGTMGLVVSSFEEPMPAEYAGPLAQEINSTPAVPESTFVATREPEVTSPFADGDAAAGLALSSYPNPSSTGEVTLRYSLKKDALTGLIIYDMNGNLVRTLLPMQSIYASSYETKYDLSDLGNGVYICEMISGNSKATTRIVISK